MSTQTLASSQIVCRHCGEPIRPHLLIAVTNQYIHKRNKSPFCPGMNTYAEPLTAPTGEGEKETKDG